MTKGSIANLGIYRALRSVEEETCNLGYRCEVEPYVSCEKFSGIIIRMHPSVGKIKGGDIVEIARRKIRALLGDPHAFVIGTITTEKQRMTVTVYAK